MRAHETEASVPPSQPHGCAALVAQLHPCHLLGDALASGHAPRLDVGDKRGLRQRGEDEDANLPQLCRRHLSVLAAQMRLQRAGPLLELVAAFLKAEHVKVVASRYARRARFGPNS